MKQRTLTILKALSHHRTVQVEIDGIDRACAPDPCDDAPGYGREGVVCDWAGRFGGAPKDGEEHDAGHFGSSERETGNGQVHAARALANLSAGQQRGPAVGHLELRHTRTTGGEGIRLVLKTGDRDPGHRWPSLLRGASGRRMRQFL